MTPDFYKIINLLYRYRINQVKFDMTLKKHSAKLFPALKTIVDQSSKANLFFTLNYDSFMAKSILSYADTQENFQEVVNSIQKAIQKKKAGA